MRKPTQKTLVWVVGIFVAATLIIGCEEKNLSDTKPSVAANKFLAIENRQLRKEIREQKKLHAGEMETQKKLHARDMERQRKLLDKCLRNKKALGELSSKGVKSYMDDILGPVVNENAKLREENENLISRIKTLQAQISRLIEQREELIKELRKRPTIPDKPQPL